MDEARLFGTDGVRGTANIHPMTAEMALSLGQAVAHVFRSAGTRRNRIIIGKDTRLSGYLFEDALAAGICSMGVDVIQVGPMPTPGMAFLTADMRCHAGVMISASHNEYRDNGIKFFSVEGTKLPDELEHKIESYIDSPMTTVESSKLGKASRIEDAAGRYIEFCKSTVSTSLDFRGLRIVVDCAHGATYHIAPHVFTEVGAEVVTICVEPDGLNINEECGATKPELLAEKVIEFRADLGIALDGDGDRLIMVDHKGEVVDGDELIYIIAKSKQQAGELQNNVVGTLMSNLGMENSLKALGLNLLRANVGDRYVMEMMIKNKAVLGGEGSGHIICLDKTTTGDGIVAALQVLAEIQQTGKSLYELKSGMQKYPQILKNVRVNKKVNLDEVESIQKAVQTVEKKMGAKGRVLLRASGTEPLIRVMVEGENYDDVVKYADQLVDDVKKAI